MHSEDLILPTEHIALLQQLRILVHNRLDIILSDFLQFGVGQLDEVDFFLEPGGLLEELSVEFVLGFVLIFDHIGDIIVVEVDFALIAFAGDDFLGDIDDVADFLGPDFDFGAAGGGFEHADEHVFDEDEAAFPEFDF